MNRRLLRTPALFAVAVVLCAVAGCAALGPSPARSGVQVVVAENFWGSIASQLGGTHATVTSIITNPNTDPHDYEPTVQDARTITTADLVIYNGVGYDPWAQRLLASSPNPRRIVLSVGDLVGVPLGGNPHLWYSPANVHKVVAQTTADYKRIDPADAAYFDRQRAEFETKGLARYDALVAAIKTKYTGVPVGASESIVTPLAQALGLKLITPGSFLSAVSEGTGPNAADKAVVDAQIRSKQIKVFIYNRQNATPDVTALVNEAKAEGIPVVTVTETLEPANATFQDWQVGQLLSLQQALREATGR
jgi:zinc/manganese transport system substrate-binding protein